VSGLVVLLGHDIGYSASPAMHAAAFAALGLDARYELADVDAAGLAGAVAALRAPDRLGANVTRPHKVAVCAHVDRLAPEVRDLGAANTIVARDGRLVAHNTDVMALATQLGEMGSYARAVVLGDGGAARAVRAVLRAAGTAVATVDRAHWSSLADALADADLLVNATPIGTGSIESPVRADLLRAGLAVFDLVYRPSPTRLVREARAAGAVARGGAGMLLAQAAASLELWTGQRAPLEAMRNALRTELGPEIDA